MPDREAFASVQNYNAAFIEEFRAHGGVVTGPMAGRTVLILITHGARSGREHLTPLVYTRDGARYVVAAANGGASRHPDWYYNLVANPDNEIELPKSRLQVVASEADGVERDRLHKNRLLESPTYVTNVERTHRRIPLMILAPRSD